MNKTPFDRLRANGVKVKLRGYARSLLYKTLEDFNTHCVSCQQQLEAGLGIPREPTE